MTAPTTHPRIPGGDERVAGGTDDHIFCCLQMQRHSIREADGPIAFGDVDQLVFFGVFGGDEHPATIVRAGEACDAHLAAEVDGVNCVADNTPDDPGTTCGVLRLAALREEQTGVAGLARRQQSLLPRGANPQHPVLIRGRVKVVGDFHDELREEILPALLRSRCYSWEKPS